MTYARELYHELKASIRQVEYCPEPLGRSTIPVPYLRAFATTAFSLSD
jgi:hypothetical protein